MANVLWTRGFWRGSGPGLACALAVWLLLHVPLLTGLEDWMLDGCFSYRGPRPSPARVVLVGLDDESLDELGKPLVYTSGELAEVVAFLKDQKARAIGLDLIVPKSLGGLRIASSRCWPTCSGPRSAASGRTSRGRFGPLPSWRRRCASSSATARASTGWHRLWPRRAGALLSRPGRPTWRPAAGWPAT
jgi:hypothetical protein